MTTTLTHDQRQALREAAKSELARRDLHEFVKQAWHVLEPHTEFIDGKHIAVICRWLMDVTAGRRQKVVINIPPGMSKSMIVSVMWPCWEWIHAPHTRFNFFSYAQELSTDHSRLRRKLLTSPWFQARWPHVQLAPDNNQATQFSSTTSPGMMTAGSVGGMATGRGGERLVVDDPMNPRMAHSDVEREGAERWFRQTLPSRLRSQQGAVVLIMQRLHDRDTTALALEFGFQMLCFPMEYEPGHPNVSPEDWRKVPGELLSPERFNAHYIAALKVQSGSYAWSGQYQQRPSVDGGGIWRTGWFNRWKAMPGDLVNFTQSWDFAAKDTKDGSFNVGQVWAERGADKYLVDQVRFRGSFSEAQNALRDLCAKWPQCRAKLIEDKANGAPILDTLQRTVGGMVATNPGKRGKAERAQAVAPFIEAGNVWVPESAPWVSDFMAEVEAFPNGAHDDQIDAASQALERLCVHPAGEAHAVARYAMSALFD